MRTFALLNVVLSVIFVSEKTLNEEVTKERLSTRTDGLSEKSIGCLNDLFDMHLNTVMGPRQDNRADDVNFRYLMWKAMASFPEIAEQRSRDVVPLFLRFVRSEMQLWFLL